MCLLCLKGEYTESGVLELPPLFLACKTSAVKGFLALLLPWASVSALWETDYWARCSSDLYTLHCARVKAEKCTHTGKQAYGGTEELPSVQEGRGAQKGTSKECQNIACYCFILWNLRLNSLHIKKYFFAISGIWFRPSGQSSGPFPLQKWFPDRIHSEEQKSHFVVTQGASICHSICIFHCPFFVFSLIRDPGDWNTDQSTSLGLVKRKGKRKTVKIYIIELKRFFLFLFSALSI